MTLNLLELFLTEENYVSNLTYISLLEGRKGAANFLTAYCVTTLENAGDIEERLRRFPDHANPLACVKCVVEHTEHKTVGMLYSESIVGRIIIDDDFL